MALLWARRRQARASSLTSCALMVWPMSRSSSEASGEELLAFLSVIARAVDEVRAENGVAALIRADGVENIRVSEVRLAVIEQEIGADEVEGLLLGLAEDPGALAAWYAAAAAGDPVIFEAELVSLIDSADDDGGAQLVKSLGKAFKSQPPTGQDALMSLAMTPGPVRDLVGDLLGSFEATQIASSLLAGVFGKNMLSLSNALSSLPLDKAAAEVRAEVEAMLPRAGHTADEIDFLDHMLAVRALHEPEPPLVVQDRTYNAVLSASTLSDEDVARAREAVAASGRDVSAAGVRAMLVLMDEQTDFERYCRSAENLAGIVPRLIEQGDLALAAHVLDRDRQPPGAQCRPLAGAFRAPRIRSRRCRRQPLHVRARQGSRRRSFARERGR